MSAVHSTDVLKSGHTRWQVTRRRRGWIQFSRSSELVWHDFQVHSGIAAHCHSRWLGRWYCNSISPKRRTLEQQGTFDFNAQLGMNFADSGIPCTATQIDTPADHPAPRVARDEIAFIFLVHMLLVKFDVRLKPVFRNFLSTVWKSVVRWKGLGFSSLLSSSSHKTSHKYHRYTSRNLSCHFSFCRFYAVLSNERTANLCIRSLPQLHLTTVEIVAKYPIFLIIITDWQQVLQTLTECLPKWVS